MYCFKLWKLCGGQINVTFRRRLCLYRSFLSCYYAVCIEYVCQVEFEDDAYIDMHVQ